MRLPPRHHRARWIALLYGASLLLWMSVEDTNVLPVVIAGLGLTLLLAYFMLTGRLGGKSYPMQVILIGAALVGAGIGAGTAIITVLLMVWKTGMHAHPFPDYPPGLILDVLRRALVWSAAGALVCTAITLLIKDEKTFTTENTENTE